VRIIPYKKIGSNIRIPYKKERSNIILIPKNQLNLIVRKIVFDKEFLNELKKMLK